VLAREVGSRAELTAARLTPAYCTAHHSLCVYPTEDRAQPSTSQLGLNPTTLGTIIAGAVGELEKTNSQLQARITSLEQQLNQLNRQSNSTTANYPQSTQPRSVDECALGTVLIADCNLPLATAILALGPAQHSRPPILSGTTCQTAPTRASKMPTTKIGSEPSLAGFSSTARRD
jgi:hypothetical protein